MADEIKLEDLERELWAAFRRAEAGILDALKLTAIRGEEVIRDNIVRAKSDLANSVHAEGLVNGARIVTSAPHAAAQEVGSRPHTPPLEPILEWVKIRGAQGLTRSGRIIRQRSSFVGSAKTTSARLSRLQARRVATQLHNHVQGGAMDIDAPLIVARAIQHAISVSGTRPRHYARSSLPAIGRILKEELDIHIPQRLREMNETRIHRQIMAMFEAFDKGKI